MRQILCNDKGALVARVPGPMVEPGSVLVRVRYSFVSAGTETAALRPPPVTAGADGSASAPQASAGLAFTYLSKAMRNPMKAARRVARIARDRVASAFPAPAAARRAPIVSCGDLEWTACAARSCRLESGGLEIQTDDSPGSYQATAGPIAIPAGRTAIVTVEGIVHGGMISVGLLSGDGSRWVAQRMVHAGSFSERVVAPADGSGSVTLVVANAGLGRASRVTINAAKAETVDPAQDGGLPASELDDQGWGLGYSLSGEVLATGPGVADLVPGDLVACAGAGQANHADYVSVKRNLVCRIPPGCPVDLAASAAVGAIALQGVRRAAPQIGDTIGVLGLGVIGQLAARLLAANGCRVLGMDPDGDRVERARRAGLTDGSTDPDVFSRLVRDRTAGHGADRVIVTAASRSSAIVNHAFQVSRARGTVVLVGDVGLDLDRAPFYRKEIDLLMSTSYGPGRYDRSFEEEGRDYPYAHVRWTLTRNMLAYLELIATGRIDVKSLIDRVVPIDDAPGVYAELVSGKRPVPLGVLISYPEDPRMLPEPAASRRITIRGHRTAPAGPLRYALVGAGAFGTSMLVPQMRKRPDRYFLRGIVSRNVVQAGNFARAHQVELLASDLDAVLSDPGFDLIVIATRHHEHADQTVRALRSGKHVFVEKPLAMSWDELGAVARAYDALEPRPLLMVGYNRRFSPALQTLSRVVAGRRAPLVIAYRVNAGYVPPEHWIQGAQGGGRNVGEACHMYDAMRSLVGSDVTQISAVSIDPAGAPYMRNDNFCVTLGFADGSIGNLVYTSLGPREGLGKERIEVYCDGDAYVVDDFRSLVRAATGQVLWESPEPDKGHAEELSRFGDAIASGAGSPIPFEEIVETTAVALHVEDLLHGRSRDVEVAAR
jgi:predicted dehydrogenase/threonine dehydrogenase-like Zn-dependent dehydrogenase